MINEKGLCACMKDAWRDGVGGYTVSVVGEEMTIRASAWIAQMPLGLVPRKALALLVEHIGTIPEDGQAFRCGKKIGAQALIAAVEAQVCGLGRVQTRGDAKVTQLHYKGTSIYQDTCSLEIVAVNPLLRRLVDPETETKAYIREEQICEYRDGSVLVWEDECTIIVQCSAIDGPTMDNKLKPCPFCGAEIKVWEPAGFGVVRVLECPNCHVRFVFPWNDKIAEHWNRRAEL